jgi:flavorubredoxin
MKYRDRNINVVLSTHINISKQKSKKRLSMEQKIITNNVFEVGAKDPDRKLFDEIIPLPNGTSYNSYVIIGSEKAALIDTVDPVKTEELLNNIKNTGVLNIDYIIANHAEQDHSGSLLKILEIYPNAKIITNYKCKNFLIDLLQIPDDKFQIVNDGDEISLGNKTLKFILTPWVHWPETMCTYLIEEKILFSCDFFGSHNAKFDLFVEDDEKTNTDAKRYYAEIMMPFRTQIKSNIEKLSHYEIKTIAPSHGPVYQNPQFIIDLYKEWISDDTKRNILIPYVSMHDSTRIIAKYIENKLKEKSIDAKLINLTDADIGDFAIELVDAHSVIFGAPCFLANIHPVANNAIFLFNSLRPKTKVVSFFGSFSWGSRTDEQFKQMISNIKPNIIEPILIKGLPKDDDYKRLDEYIDEIIKRY